MSIIEVAKGSFIYQQKKALPDFLCQDMISRFEQSPNMHYQGRVGANIENNSGLKKTTDLAVTGNKKWEDVENNLFRSLGVALKTFKTIHPYFKELRGFAPSGFNIQRYQAGDYYHWHVDSDSPQLAERQLVALWYLNTLKPEQGGSTDFLHQNVSIQPEQGSLVLFPPFWMHEHRAALIQSGVKYIATTWVTYS